ncbi:alpha/beta hydrolase [Ruminococcus sp.]|uniref:alpha/beta fold hydrolase n=1 Tax=Ruminococcus sp. TaxID=41978 RepID=UPI0025CC0D57|nr:alpha/beta hydrolase [Ruminococcus sp.]MBQ8967106.1 alpha/beta hydrolase [Ruminococcus sp.]
MGIADLDMKKEFAYYNKVAPKKTAAVLGKKFTYRYYKNPDPKVNATMVMLAGGTGLGDAFSVLARKFIDRYSLINFNYPMGFKNNAKTADAIAELIKKLGAENVYLWGQSYGGALAQIIAKRHPDVVKGLILTSTASMSNDLKFSGMKCLVDMFGKEKEKKDISFYKKLPMSLLTPIMNLAFKKHLKNDPAAQAVIREILEQVKPDMTREYFCHMTRLLGDLREHLGTHRKEDFDFLKGRVLIIEPDDDKTFTDDVKQELVRMMPDPEVVHELKGGHLAMLFDIDGFLDIINSFMDRQAL